MPCPHSPMARLPAPEYRGLVHYSERHSMQLKSETSKAPARRNRSRDPASDAGKGRRRPKEEAILATSSANSGSADPDARHRSLDQPVGEVTRHI